ncbi:MAG: hypothetical protein ACRCT8_12505 [Lacipirellulaceae bacterium]
MPPTLRRLAALSFLLMAVAGCSARFGLSQQLEGEWTGRPETAVERSRREWPRPGGSADAALQGRDDPSLDGLPTEALDKVDRVAPTELESFADVRIDLTLAGRGKAKLVLRGVEEAEPLEGSWRATAGEGGAALLEIAVDRRASDSGEAPSAQRVAASPRREVRRYELRLIPGEERFTLIEQGADPRFGRLIFERAN